MQQEYVSLLTRFYERTVENARHGSLLTHALQRLLNFETKEKDGSLRAVTAFDKVKKLFYSNNIETAIIFCNFLARTKNAQTSSLISLLAYSAERLKNMKSPLLGEDRKRFTGKIGRLSEQLQFLGEKVGEGRSIQWLFFESESLLTAQLLASQGDTLETRQSMRANDYATLLKVLGAQCCLLDYSTRETKVMGEGDRIFVGRRSETYFLLTEKEFQRASAGQALVVSRRVEQRREEREQRKNYTGDKFKQQFLGEMMKLRQTYESNTSTIAALFRFKDANDQKQTDETKQA